MAADARGPEAARPYVERVNPSFPTVVDAGNVFGQMFAYNAIPNGIFVDEEGIVRYKHLGKFSVENADHVTTVERLIAGDIEQVDEAVDNTVGDALARELSDTKFRLGVEYLRQGRVEEALAQLERARDLNRESFVIRKQIWAIKFPERFHPTIDWDWQKSQLAKERAEEAKRDSDCGPEGCAL